MAPPDHGGVARQRHPYPLFGFAEQAVNSNLTGAINATGPLWTVLIATLLRQGQPLRWIQWVGMLVGFAGALLVLSQWHATAAPLPDQMACAGAAASYGVGYVCMGRYLTGRGIPPIVLSAAQLIADYHRDLGNAHGQPHPAYSRYHPER